MNSERYKDLVIKYSASIFIIAITIYRQPELLYQPRFLAEEGTYYFHFAFTHSWINNLFTPFLGYNTLFNSIATSLAAMAPLEYSPLVTAYLAMLVQLLASFMVIWGKIPLLETNLKRFALAVSIPLLSYARGWLTIIGTHFWLAVVTFLILLGDPLVRSRGRYYFDCGLLFLSGLTGVVSCFMTPAFLIKAIRAKSGKFAVYTGILALSTFVQIGIFLKFYLLDRDPSMATRLVKNDPLTLLTKTLTFQYGVPFFGRSTLDSEYTNNIAVTINNWIIRTFGNSIFTSEFQLLSVLLGVLVIVFFVIFFIFKCKNLDAQVMMLSFILTSFLSIAFSVRLSGGPRYAFAPSVMLMALLVAFWNDRSLNLLVRGVSTLLILSSLITGFIDFRLTMKDFAYSDSWPKWKDEVKIWRTDPSYQLKIWPAPEWSLSLQKSPGEK